MKSNTFVIDFKLRQNRLLDEHGHPYNLKKQYPVLFTPKTIIILSSRVYPTFSPALMEKFFNKLDELRIRRNSIEISFKNNEVWINREYWGGESNYIEANIADAAFFWFLSVSPLKIMFPEFVIDTLQRKSARETVYDLRYANLKKSEIINTFKESKSIKIHRANIYRWIDEFEKSEVARRRNECIYRTLHSLYCVNNGNNYKWRKFINDKGFLEFKGFNFTRKELLNIDNLCGKMKKHIRRTKKQIAEDK